jgi:hypothetical protein
MLDIYLLQSKAMLGGIVKELFKLLSGHVVERTVLCVFSGQVEKI